RLVHNLAGSGLTFGFEALSKMAQVLDVFLQGVIQKSHPPTPEQCHQITTLIQQLEEAPLPAVGNFPLKSPEAKPQDQADARTIATMDRRMETQEHLVFLLESDWNEGAILGGQLQSFGYEVRLFQNLSNLQESIANMSPSAILINIDFLHSYAEESDFINQVRSVSRWSIPIFFISSEDSLESRIRAVRAQGNAYFTKPINVWQLVDKLDRLVIHSVSETYHILIVEDDPVLADYYQLILRDAGMQTTIVTNPSEIMEPLIESKPDLILMDVYMPDFSGLELAVVIRQQDTFVSIPITYLSRETNIDKQMLAMSMGGDDFLTKPIQPEHLVAAVTSRVQRSKALRSLMVRDSLTGLLNHSNIKEKLHLEVARSDRQNIPLSFAMIDIDHFKKINDTYGHLAGDRVIKNLARLLRQRLRQTDILGRYGGEEFAAILIGTDGHTAFKVLESIRQDFSHVAQQLGGAEITVTFSCGIASFPDYIDANHINDAADQALYQAKDRARNCTVLSLPNVAFS
ncbi:MAG: diguanylate cyclase, partial [Prochlorotrichaceae cyanobacterium]